MINERLLILILLLLLLNKWIRTVFVFNYMMHCKYIVIGIDQKIIIYYTIIQLYNYTIVQLYNCIV